MNFATIATISGRERQCEAAISSLESQMDSITFHKNHEKGDAAKFITDYSGYHFPCDDDLVMPLDYEERMVAKLQEYGNKVIVTCMGRILHLQPIGRYYKNATVEKLSCLDKVEQDAFCHIGGTGVMAYHTDYFQPDLEGFKNGYMADIWLSLQAQKKQIPILVMAHEAGWILQQDVGSGIYEKFRDNDSEQVKAVNSIKWVIYETEKAT